MTRKLFSVCDTLGPCRLSCTCVDSILDPFRPLPSASAHQPYCRCFGIRVKRFCLKESGRRRVGGREFHTRAQACEGLSGLLKRGVRLRVIHLHFQSVSACVAVIWAHLCLSSGMICFVVLRWSCQSCCSFVIYQLSVLSEVKMSM